VAIPLGPHVRVQDRSPVRNHLRWPENSLEYLSEGKGVQHRREGKSGPKL
jgi:hypothetical protein